MITFNIENLWIAFVWFIDGIGLGYILWGMKKKNANRN